MKGRHVALVPILTLAAVAGSLTAEAQQSEESPRIEVLSPFSPSNAAWLHKALATLAASLPYGDPSGAAAACETSGICGRPRRCA